MTKQKNNDKEKKNYITRQEVQVAVELLDWELR